MSSTKSVPGFKMVGEDGNAFAILGRFLRCARRAQLPSAEIEAIMAAARSGDYDHLLATLAPYEDAGRPADRKRGGRS